MTLLTTDIIAIIIALAGLSTAVIVGMVKFARLSK